MRGWVCLRCGFRAFRQTSRDVHQRRALRGLGCIHDLKRKAEMFSEARNALRTLEEHTNPLIEVKS